jgi:hypothetical protein
VATEIVAQYIELASLALDIIWNKQERRSFLNKHIFSRKNAKGV